MQAIRGDLVLFDCVERGEIFWENGCFVTGRAVYKEIDPDLSTFFWDGYITPGFIDLHVHGGGGADFMDGTPEAFRLVCQAHARHGTTRLLATSTVAAPELIERFLATCDAIMGTETGGARVAGAHFYGPYFAPGARGCHPALGLVDPHKMGPASYLDHSCIRTATVAPELLGAGEFLQECKRRGITGCMGHSHATFEQVAKGVAQGARHVDHLFCAMSDRARLRQSQAFPMRGGLLEATLAFDELTTEVIADDRHLADELLMLAYKCKGPDRLEILTDSMRAMDMPDGDYWFGAEGLGELVSKRNGVGLTLDGKGLASAVQGLDVGLRVMQRATKAPLHDLIRMLTITPARIAGLDREFGSLAHGKIADLVLLDRDLIVQGVVVAGEWVMRPASLRAT